MNRRQFLKHGFAGLIALAMPAGLGISSIVDEGQRRLPHLVVDREIEKFLIALGEALFPRLQRAWLECIPDECVPEDLIRVPPSRPMEIKP